MDQSQIRFPQHLDDPKPFLLWTADEIVPFGVWLSIGIVTRTLLICLVVGVTWVIVWRRVRDNLPAGFLVHYLYWLGVPVKGRVFVNPYVDEIRGP